jgi:hypothetical protein
MPGHIQTAVVLMIIVAVTNMITVVGITKTAATITGRMTATTAATTNNQVVIKTRVVITSKTQAVDSKDKVVTTRVASNNLHKGNKVAAVTINHHEARVVKTRAVGIIANRLTTMATMAVVTMAAVSTLPQTKWE